MTIQVMTGDCRQVLDRIEAGSVNTVVTSPPYFGLRNYGHDEQIGLEETPAEFVSQLVEVFRKVRRVLRDDGTVWLNLGDTYARDPRKGQHKPGDTGKQSRVYDQGGGRASSSANAGLREKNLIGIPWRVAFALQEDGWILRQDIIWNKPNVTPESVKDRCTKAHEYIFLLSKSDRYYFDYEAIQEPSTNAGKRDTVLQREFRVPSTVPEIKKSSMKTVPGMRNKRSVWSVNTVGFSGSHFATFPPELIRPCILAGCPTGGVVLDPFFGSGTTGLVADSLGRNAIGIELNPQYAKIAQDRNASLFSEVVSG